MPAPDEKYRALAKRGRATIWDERVRLFFRRSGDIADPERNDRDAMAAVRTGNESVANASGGGAQSWSSRIASGQATAWITRATYDGPPIRAGDKLRRLDRAGQPFFKVESIDDRDASDLILSLTAI